MKSVLSLASPESIKNAVAAGIGLAFISRLVIEEELKARRLGIVRLKDLTIERPLHLQRVRGRSESPAVVKFLEVLKARK